MTDLTPDLASHFARTALAHVGREWPNKLDHVMAGPKDVQNPRSLHPVFYGSFDWHSCVHGYWLLARLYRRFPRMRESAHILELLDSQLVPHKIAAEAAYAARPESRGFERPYGWAWALMLASELEYHESEEGRRWCRNFAPLADLFVGRFAAWLPLANYPVRAGVHSNTAFALLLAHHYAQAVGSPDFGTLLREKALDWYEKDADCQAWEPCGDDFLSSALIEAACMRTVISPKAFVQWLAGFLPSLARGAPETLFSPVLVSDRTDGKIAHLDGLNLSRAWCWRQISAAVEDDGARARIDETIARHLAAALPHVTGDYMGEHWLASFALLALDPHPP